MNFGIDSAFSKGLGSAFSEGPRPGPGPLYKVCPVKVMIYFVGNLSYGTSESRCFCNMSQTSFTITLTRTNSPL